MRPWARGILPRFAASPAPTPPPPGRRGHRPAARPLQVIYSGALGSVSSLAAKDPRCLQPAEQGLTALTALTAAALAWAAAAGGGKVGTEEGRRGSGQERAWAVVVAGRSHPARLPSLQEYSNRLGSFTRRQCLLGPLDAE